MATKERLQRLVDELHDAGVPAAEQALEGLRYVHDPVARSLASAPLDDEPDDDDFDGGLTGAREEAARGDTIPLEEVRRDLAV